MLHERRRHSQSQPEQEELTSLSLEQHLDFIAAVGALLLHPQSTAMRETMCTRRALSSSNNTQK